VTFQKTNSVTIFLGEAGRGNRLTGKGLEHRSRGRDTHTVVENIQGVPCRSLHLTVDGVSKGYFVLSIDPTFKEQDISKVRIDVDYFDGLDQQAGVFGVQYDAKGSDQNAALTVKQVLPNVVLKGFGPVAQGQLSPQGRWIQERARRWHGFSFVGQPAGAFC